MRRIVSALPETRKNSRDRREKFPTFRRRDEMSADRAGTPSCNRRTNNPEGVRMPRSIRRIVSALPLLAAAVVAVIYVAPHVSGQAANAGYPSKDRGEWASYNADIKGSRYMPFDQIDAVNFNKLEIAWHFKTDNLGPRPEYKLEGTPLMVKGTVYLTGGTRRAVVALDAKSGEQKEIYSG